MPAGRPRRRRSSLARCAGARPARRATRRTRSIKAAPPTTAVTTGAPSTPSTRCSTRRSSSAPRTRWSRRTSCLALSYFFVNKSKEAEQEVTSLLGAAAELSARPDRRSAGRRALLRGRAPPPGRSHQRAQEARARGDRARAQGRGAPPRRDARQGRAHLRRPRRREAQPAHRASALRRRPGAERADWQGDRLRRRPRGSSPSLR